MTQSFTPNEGQQKALDAAPDATLAIIAGAGTGKTETLARRYVKLLMHDSTLHPRNIVVLTFTEKAATEMRARIMYTVVNQGLPFDRIDMAEAHISTFHAFAAHLALQRSIALNLNPDEPFCEESARDDIGQACWDRFLDHGWHDAIAHLAQQIDEYDWNDDAIYALVNTMIADAKGLGHRKESIIAAVRQTNDISARHELYGHLLAWNFVARAHDLSLRGQLDLDDLIQIVPMLRAQFPELFRHIRYVMVDEYQDTSTAQAHLLESITPRDNTVAKARTVVGDPRQAIYVWRQANVQNIVQMKEQSAVQVNLTENRRSLAPILAVANRSLATYQFGDPVEFEATAQLHPPASTPAAPADCVRLWHFAERTTEADAIAHRMRELHQTHHVAYGDMAVLLRQRTHLDVYAEAMQRVGIPFDRGKNDPFYHRPLILDAIHLLIACYDPANEQSLARTLLSTTRTCDETSLRAIRQQHHDASLWQLLQLSGESFPRIRQFADHLMQTQHAQWEVVPAEWFAGAIERFGLWERDGAYGQRMLTKLINDCRAMQVGTSQELIGELLNRIRHEPDSASPELKTNMNAVQIMTVHAAKGLEFTAVFVPDAHAFGIRQNKQITFQSGLLVDPTSDNLQQQAAHTALERQKSNEMIALWYVALTRAKQYLMVSATKLDKGALFTQMYESIQNDPIYGVECASIVGDITAPPTQDMSIPHHASSIQTTRLGSKHIIALSPSALHELMLCPQRYRFQRRSGLDELLINSDDNYDMHWTDAPHDGYYTLPVLQSAWHGMTDEPGEQQAFEDPESTGADARALGSLFHLAAELHAYHPNADATQLTALALKRYGKPIVTSAHHIFHHMVATYLASPLGSNPPLLHEVEQRLRWKVETPLAVVEMTGVIDRIWHGTIIDYKTDEHIDGIAERHGDQLRLYAQAWMRQHKLQSAPQIAVYHARTGIMTPIDNDDYSMQQTHQRVVAAATHLVKGDYPARPSQGYCSHCPARAICPDGKTLLPVQDIPAFEPFGW